MKFRFTGQSLKMMTARFVIFLYRCPLAKADRSKNQPPRSCGHTCSHRSTRSRCRRTSAPASSQAGPSSRSSGNPSSHILSKIYEWRKAPRLPASSTRSMAENWSATQTASTPNRIATFSQSRTHT